ncbi:MAG: ABC transporter permease [Clostridia bacterium]|nr:ABC transporter permease [Clostridia bacterium]MBR6762133.1 ABC transporter permease [Clostridia bacterium]
MNPEVKNTIPAEYKPLSPWAYFGYNLLFSIPVVGFICILVFALGGGSNINLKNYARSFFCVYALALILAIIMVILVVALGATSAIMYEF